MVMFCLQIRKQGWKQPEGLKKGEQRQKKKTLVIKRGSGHKAKSSDEEERSD